MAKEQGDYRKKKEIPLEEIDLSSGYIVSPGYTNWKKSLKFHQS